MPKTKIDSELEALAEEHAGDPVRADVIHRARRFKSSWIELAQGLAAVRRQQLFRTWGYDSFEAYAKAELHLRAETAEKLTASYGFLERRAPEVLKRDGLREKIPDYSAVEFLRRAEENEAAPREAVEAVRRRVIDEGASAASVAKQWKAEVLPIDPAERRESEAAGVRAVAARLKTLLAGSKVVPRALSMSVTLELDRLLALLGSGERAA